MTIYVDPDFIRTTYSQAFTGIKREVKWPDGMTTTSVPKHTNVFCTFSIPPTTTRIVNIVFFPGLACHLVAYSNTSLFLAVHDTDVSLLQYFVNDFYVRTRAFPFPWRVSKAAMRVLLSDGSHNAGWYRAIRVKQSQIPWMLIHSNDPTIPPLSKRCENFYTYLRDGMIIPWLKDFDVDKLFMHNSSTAEVGHVNQLRSTEFHLNLQQDNHYTKMSGLRYTKMDEPLLVINRVKYTDGVISNATEVVEGQNVAVGYIHNVIQLDTNLRGNRIDDTHLKENVTSNFDVIVLQIHSLGYSEGKGLLTTETDVYSEYASSTDTLLTNHIQIPEQQVFYRVASDSWITTKETLRSLVDEGLVHRKLPGSKAGWKPHKFA